MTDIKGVHRNVIILMLLVCLALPVGIQLAFLQEQETVHEYEVTVEHVTVQDESEVIAYESLDSFEREVIRETIRSEDGISDGAEHTIESDTDHGDIDTIKTVSVDGTVALVSIEYVGTDSHPQNNELAFIGVLLTAFSICGLLVAGGFQEGYASDCYA